MKSLNNMLGSAKNQVQCDFGHLKATGNSLQKKLDLKLEILPPVMYLCFI